MWHIGKVSTILKIVLFVTFLYLTPQNYVQLKILCALWRFSALNMMVMLCTKIVTFWNYWQPHIESQLKMGGQVSSLEVLVLCTVKLIQAVLSIPVINACPERISSLMNASWTRSSNCMDKHLVKATQVKVNYSVCCDGLSNMWKPNLNCLVFP